MTVQTTLPGRNELWDAPHPSHLLPRWPSSLRWVRAVLVVGVLGGLSLWSWRSMVAGGLGGHAPPFRSVGDVGQGIVFMGWLPYALAHGTNPFFTRTMFAPEGVNLLSNTSFFLPAFVLAPVTILSGPVASFDVAVLLGPVISGLALYFVLRRYGISTFSALVAAVFYAYSPYMAQEIPLGHFNLTWLFFPPLLYYLLDGIFWRQDLAPARSGAALGLLVIAQFFNSLEILVEASLVATLLLVLTAAARPREVATRLPCAGRAIATAVAVAGPLLAYPFWFSQFGPGHVTTFNTTVSTIDNAVTSAVWPSAAPPIFGHAPSFLGRIDSGFVGPVICLVVLASCALWRNHRYRLLPLAFVGALVTYALTWGPYLRISSTGTTKVKGPDYWLLNVPVLRNVQEYRFAALTDLFCAVCIAACLDWGSRWVMSRPRLSHPAAAWSLGVVAALSILAFPAIGDRWHQPVQSVTVPPVLTSRTVAQLPGGTVTVVEPPGDIASGAPLVWQAEHLMGVDETNGYAWRQVSSRGLGSTEGPVTPLTDLLGPGLLAQVPSPPGRFPQGLVMQLRSQLRSWHVGAVVLVKGYPDTASGDVRIMTRVLGVGPHHIDGSAVWTNIARDLARYRRRKG